MQPFLLPPSVSPTHIVYSILCQITRWCAVALAPCFVYAVLLSFDSVSSWLATKGQDCENKLPADETVSCVCECHVKRVKLVSEAVQRLQHFVFS